MAVESDVICARMPVGSKARIAAVAGGPINAWLKALIERALTDDQPADAAGQRWRPLLGDELAARVAAVAAEDPGAFCRDAIERLVAHREQERREAARRRSERERCLHPEAQRSVIGQCKTCGAMGLPAAASAKPAKARATRKR